MVVDKAFRSGPMGFNAIKLTEEPHPWRNFTGPKHLMQYLFFLCQPRQYIRVRRRL